MKTYIDKRRKAVKKTTFVGRIHNAINAFRGKPIGSVQYGIEVKQCDKCEHINNSNTVLYVCDGKACDYCNHTTDIKHAVNFKADEIDDNTYYIENDNV